jgi:hypothetical protein
MPSESYIAEPLPEHAFTTDWSSPFYSPSPLTPSAEKIKDGVNTDGDAVALQRSSFFHQHRVISDSSGAASPAAFDSPYSNNHNKTSGSYSGGVGSSQNSVSSPRASSCALILPPPPLPPYLHGGQSMAALFAHHERNRQKNRAAAARCRKKNKHRADQLLGQERDLSSRKEFLTACITDLRDEVLALKHEILRHSDCDCDLIQNYLAAAATNCLISTQGSHATSRGQC